MPRGTTRGTERRQNERRSVEELIPPTHDFLAAAGIERSAAWVSRTVRSYSRSAPPGLPLVAWLCGRLTVSAERRRQIARDRPDLAYVLTYADPTGEAAVRRDPS